MKQIFFVLPLLFFGCGTSNGLSNESNVTEVMSIYAGAEKNALTRHNEIRKELFLGSDMQWSIELAQSAQTYANKLAQNGRLEHDSTNQAYGENLYAASFRADYLDAINSWYTEKSFYNYVNNSCQAGRVCGHYTQMIWKDSVELGCAIARYTQGRFRGGSVIVCRYNPPGNYIGVKPY